MKMNLMFPPAGNIQNTTTHLSLNTLNTKRTKYFATTINTNIFKKFVSFSKHNAERNDAKAC